MSSSMSSLVSRNGSPPENRVPVPNGTLSIVPNELLTGIFSILDFRTLGVIPLVCKNWKAICQNPGFNFTKQILVPMFGREAYTQLQHYAIDRQLDADQLCSKYSSLFQFLHKSSFRIDATAIPHCVTSSPYYQELCHEDNQEPFCHNGRLGFFIQDATTICSTDPKTRENFSFVLEGEKHIKNIACKGDFLFALCGCGTIIQWDLCFQKLIREIVASEKQSFIGSSINRTISFCIMDNQIIICSKTDTQCNIEIIPINPDFENERVYLEFEAEEHSICAIEDHLVYIHTKNSGKSAMLIYDIKAKRLAEAKGFPDCYFGKKHIYENMTGWIPVFEKNFEKEIGKPVGHLIYGDGGHMDKSGDFSQAKRVNTKFFEYQNFLISLSDKLYQRRGPDLVCSSIIDITIWDINAIYLKGPGEVLTEPIYKSHYTDSPVDIIAKIEEAMSKTKPDLSLEERITDFVDEGKKVFFDIWNSVSTQWKN